MYGRFHIAKAFGKDESWLTNGIGYDSDVSGWQGIEVTNGRVTTIDWSGLGLRGPISKEIDNLTNLQILSLHNNYLSGDIPTELSNLTYLHDLSLSDNELSCEMSNICGDRNKVIQFLETERKRVSHTLLQ